MKKILVLVMVMAMCSTVFALKPVIVRDKLFTHQYYTYVPADKDGVYWTKYILRKPASSATTRFPIAEVLYGKPYTGQWQTVATATTSGTGTYDASALGATYNIYYAYSNAAVVVLNSSGDYIEWDIPQNHNRIELYWYYGANRPVNVTLTNGSGLDVISFGSTGTQWYGYKTVLAANATVGASAKLRLTATTSGNVYIIGIHTFNTNSPSTSPNGDNDIIDAVVPSDTLSSAITAVTNFSDLVMYRNTCEFTISWKPHAESTYKWTGYGAHYGSGNADFTLSASPNLYIDGVLIGDMADTAIVPLGTSYEADSITEYAAGYGAWDADDHELNIKQTKDFTQSGVSIGVCVNVTDADIDIGACYVPSILVPSATYGGVATTGWCKTLPTDTEIELNSNWSDKKGNSLLIQYTNKEFTIYTNASAPISSIFENADADTAKIYMNVKTAIFSATNDTVITNGTIFSTGAFIQILKRNQYGVFQDYTWPAAANIKKDQTCFDGITTTTGTYNPSKGWLNR